jgi:hypothetical protein
MWGCTVAPGFDFADFELAAVPSWPSPIRRSPIASPRMSSSLIHHPIHPATRQRRPLLGTSETGDEAFFDPTTASCSYCRGAATLVVFGLTLTAVAVGAAGGASARPGAPAGPPTTPWCWGRVARSRPRPAPGRDRTGWSACCWGRPGDLDTATAWPRLCIEAARREADPAIWAGPRRRWPLVVRPAPADDEVLRCGRCSARRATTSTARWRSGHGWCRDRRWMPRRTWCGGSAVAARDSPNARRPAARRWRRWCRRGRHRAWRPRRRAAAARPGGAARGRGRTGGRGRRTASAPGACRCWARSGCGRASWPAAERALRRSLALDAGRPLHRGGAGRRVAGRGRPAEVRALLSAVDPDARGRGAAAAAGDRRAPAGGAPARRWPRSCARRFAAERRRGRTCTAARRPAFLLEVERQPALALAAATRNWQVQREYWDARVLREADSERGGDEADWQNHGLPHPYPLPRPGEGKHIVDPGRDQRSRRPASPTRPSRIVRPLPGRGRG